MISVPGAIALIPFGSSRAGSMTHKSTVFVLRCAVWAVTSPSESSKDRSAVSKGDKPLARIRAPGRPGSQWRSREEQQKLVNVRFALRPLQGAFEQVLTSTVLFPRMNGASGSSCKQSSTYRSWRWPAKRAMAGRNRKWAKQLATNVRGGAVAPNTGHWLPDDNPAFISQQLLTFFGNEATDSTPPPPK